MRDVDVVAASGCFSKESCFYFSGSLAFLSDLLRKVLSVSELGNSSRLRQKLGGF